MFELTKDDIESIIEQKKESWKDSRVGAKVCFEGIVRDYNDGENVESLEFEVFDEMALAEGKKIIDEACERFTLYQAYCVHRTGHLHITDIAVWIVVTAGHRQEAFDACRFIIDQLKVRVPIWKKEHYRQRPATWLKGHVPGSENDS